jgi:threonine synthase
MPPNAGASIEAAARDWMLQCTACGRREPLGPQVYGCETCRAGGRTGLLECVREGHERPPWPRGSARGVARYRHLLPAVAGDALPSMGEGGTALVRSSRIGPRLGLRHLYFKLEQQNPTMSFKDRYVALTLDLAHRFGFRRTVVASTGNLGISVAAYSARYGMACTFVAPTWLPDNIRAEAALHGAELELVEKEERFARFEELAHAPDRFPVGLFMARSVQNPFGIEAYRTIAYEVIEELNDVPHSVLFPCARGNGLYGAWKGFRDARDWGWVETAPRVIACQPALANSLEESLRQNSPTAVELPPADSIARSVCETIAADKALQAIRESGGTAASASDDEIIEAVRDLGREGLNVEAGSAATVACLSKLVARGELMPESIVVCVLTGGGIRWPEQAAWVA